VLKAINAPKLLCSIGRDMLDPGLCPVIMTGFGAEAAAGTGLQCAFERLVQLCIKSFEREFNSLCHLSLP
jgi:hypothetical protein